MAEAAILNLTFSFTETRGVLRDAGPEVQRPPERCAARGGPRSL